MNAQTTAAFAQDKNVGGIAPAVLTDAQLRANAAECQVIATYWPDLLKSEYEGLARQWLVLADQAERNRAANTNLHGR